MASRTVVSNVASKYNTKKRGASYLDPKEQPDAETRHRMIYCQCEGGSRGVTEEVISTEIDVGADRLMERTERRCMTCGRLAQ
jgi:hypothetical protein